MRKKLKQMYPNFTFKQILHELVIDRQIKSACKELVFDDQLLKIKFLKGINYKVTEVKFLGKSTVINNIINKLNDKSSDFEILKRFLDPKEKFSYGKSYQSGLNIVKYLIRLSSRQNERFFKNLTYLLVFFQVGFLIYSFFSIFYFDTE
jgi:hypothetical protein